MEDLEAPPSKVQESLNTSKFDVENSREPLGAEKVGWQSATQSSQIPIEEDEPIYPHKFKLALIILALSLAVFSVGLDNTIISSAIPKITDQFHALDDVGWYASSYLLTTCSFQLTWGKAYTFYPVKWTFLASLFVFELGSLVCGAAPNSTGLIVGRAVAGVGGGGVASGSFLLVAHSVPPRKRAMMIGLIGGMYGFASIAGPLMGGAFTDSSKLTWRFCFYINLPIGLVTAVCVLSSLHSSGMKTTSTIGFKDQLKQLDLPGTSFLVPGLVCLLLSLQWGGTQYEWKSGRIITLLVLAAVLLTGFIVIQIRSGDRATVPGRVFGNRNVWGSVLFGSCIIGCFYVMLYYIPIWFQAIKGVKAVESGIMNLPMVLSFVLFSFVSGTLTSLTGHYLPWLYLSVVFLAIGSGLLSTLDVNSGSPKWIGYQFIFGSGIGFGMQAAFASVQTALPLQDIPIGTAIILFSENLTGAVMVSVAQNVFANQLVNNLSTYVPTIDLSNILAVGATQIKSQVPEELYSVVLIAYNKSLTQTFYVGVAISCCSIFGVVGLQSLSVKGKKIKANQVEATD